MGRIIVMNHVTLDGVIQGPGRPDEDTRGGFVKGGWGGRSASPDDACGKAMGQSMTSGGGLAGWLFGRWTYEQLLSHWNSQRDNPFASALNNTPKYVVSSTLSEPLPWPNSTLLRGDVADAVGLIDEYLLMIHPIVLGSGRRLFPDNVETPLRLTHSLTTTTEIIIATYEPARD